MTLELAIRHALDDIDFEISQRREQTRTASHDTYVRLQSEINGLALARGLVKARLPVT
jgi:hypothetical protein